MAAHIIDITQTIDRQRIGAFQKKIAAFCSVIAALEGFNTQAVGYVAPALAQAFHLQARDLGLLFSLGLFGLLCGAVFVAPLADRVGRRPILLFCIPLLGLFSLATAFSTSVAMLDALRFATGLAVGGALPNTIALTSEYSPRRRRALMVAVMFSGFIVGSIVAGLAASGFTAAGWKWVFIIGGTSSLLFAPLLVWQLPESVRFLILRKGAREKIAGLVRRLYPQLLISAESQFTAAEASSAAASLRSLFRDGRARGTLLLWVISFASLFNIFLMANWLPTEMRTLGFPITFAILSRAQCCNVAACAAFSGAGSPTKSAPMSRCLSPISAAPLA